MNEIRFVPYKNGENKTKKKQNAFIYFRNEMLKRDEFKVRMCDISRRIVDKWMELTEEEKDEWRRMQDLSENSQFNRAFI
ncbi:hypothetical protein GLOIN_2v1766062 [Rhizophagus clarus]|uniref:HMG box domain-containing protein n=1 Tax=Rhizophagus clarus TaxID=94130 RepID=A0A8H3LN38_9GLOM|nr:hypothetical protein GLOIN_2v1766062 [Rhizophagus clarus]